MYSPFPAEQACVLVSQCQRVELPSWAVTRTLHLCCCWLGLSVPKSRDGSMHHSSHLPTTHDTSPSCAAISRTSLPCPQNSSVSSLPLKRPAVSWRHLKAKPLPTVILPVPGRREGWWKDQLTPDHSSAGEQRHAAAADPDTPLLNQDIWVFATPAPELAATLRVTVSALVDSAVPDNN